MRVALDTNVLVYAEGFGDAARCLECPNTDGSADRARCGSPMPKPWGAISCPHYQSRATDGTDSAADQRDFDSFVEAAPSL